VLLGNCYFDERVLNDVENNVWVRMNDDIATVGINTILAWLGGAFKGVTFKEPGTQVERGKSVGSVESLRHFDVVRSPFSGTILEVNSKLKVNPALLNKDQYGEGWFARIRPSAFSDEVKHLRDTNSVRGELEKRIEQLRIHCLSVPGPRDVRNRHGVLRNSGETGRAAGQRLARTGRPSCHG
jgi:glycine cleavage system H lipoate-binding protein